MSKPLQKEEAQILRKGGETISLIARKLKVSKSTVSKWCKEILLTEVQRTKIKNVHKKKSLEALSRFIEKRKKQTSAEISHAEKIGMSDVGKISQRYLFFVGLALYWGEGYKKGNNELGFTNSDPHIVLFFIKWLMHIYDIQTEQLILRVSINDLHKNRVNEVVRFWSNLTKVPESQFTKTSLIKTISKKVYKNPEDHFGTLRVKVRRGSILRKRIKASLAALESESRAA